MTRFLRRPALAAILVLLASCQAPAVGDVAPGAIAAGTDVDPGGGISRLLSIGSIGTTKAFLERTLGESTYETPDSASYMLDGCGVELTFGDGAVTAISVTLAPGCRFDAAGLVGETAMIDGPVSFARFEEIFGSARYTSPCLSLCGNAYDPFVDAVVQGYRANGFTDIAAHAAFVTDPALDAASTWADQLTARAGEDFVFDTKFNCSNAHDDIARAAFADVPVQSITFGAGLGTFDCD